MTKALHRYCVSEDGETLDRLIWRIFGRQDGLLVEQALDLNPGIASVGATLEAGRTVILPNAIAEPEDRVVRLWD